MANAARDQREATLALQGEVEAPGADAGGPLVLVMAQQNVVMRHAGGDPFDAHEPPEEFTREEVLRVYAGESDFYTLMDSYDRLAGRHQYALGYAKLARSSRAAMWREKEKALDDLETARKEIARLNEVRAQRDSAVSELRVALGKLEVKLEAAQTENARLHQMNLELVTARHDALLSDIVRPKKRPRVDDDAAANH